MGVPGSANPLLLASTAADTGYQVSRSLRFNSSDSAFCSRVFSSAGNRTAWTFSCWVKRSTLGGRQVLFGAYGATSDTDWLEFGFGNDPGSGEATNCLYWTTANINGYSSAVFRDTSAWYHIVVSYNGSNLIAYVNASTVLTASRTGNLGVNGAWLHTIGRGPSGGIRYFDGYLAEIHFIDGQALTPSSFAETNATTGQWVPKAFSGSYGTNGFKLDFADNSAATAAALGKDTSGNGNNWTPNNFAVSANPVYSLYTTASPGFSGSYPVTRMFDGNTATEAITSNSSGVGSITFTPNTAIAYSSGVEVYNATGVAITATLNGGSPVTLSTTTGWNTVASGSGSITSLALSRSNGAVAVSAIRINGATILTDGAGAGNDSLVDTPVSSGTDAGAGGEVRGNYATLNPLLGYGTLANGNLDASGTIMRGASIGVTSGKWYFEVTAGSIVVNSWIGIYPNPSSFSLGYVIWGNAGADSSVGGTASFSSYTLNSGDIIGVAFDRDNSTVAFTRNGSSVGQWAGLSLGTVPWFCGMHTNASATNPYSFNFGQRPFAYTAPSGFRALCDTNLPTPTIVRPSTVFDTTLYTGNGSTQNITGLGFSPDFVWIKARSQPYSNTVFDAIRGATNYLYTDTTGAEATNAQFLTAFNSDGFSLGTNAAVNQSSTTYVAWTWDAGSSTVTNTQGSITSSVRANASAGFSAVTYTGNGTAGATIGHGLGVAPRLIIIKRRDGTSGWNIYTTVIDGSLDFFDFSTGAKQDSAQAVPTSSVFSVSSGTNVNANTGTYVAYCWAPVSGYSSFTSFTANGLDDNAFVYTGFRPRWLMWKRTNGLNSWGMIDAARSPYNVAGNYLLANTSDAEASAALFDLLSNGFKMRTSGFGNGEIYLAAAFAEFPFQYARAR